MTSPAAEHRTGADTQAIMTAALTAHQQHPAGTGVICTCGAHFATARDGWEHTGDVIDAALGDPPQARTRPAVHRLRT